jgi:hypothetical protein
MQLVATKANPTPKSSGDSSVFRPEKPGAERL